MLIRQAYWSGWTSFRVHTHCSDSGPVRSIWLSGAQNVLLCVHVALQLCVCELCLLCLCDAVMCVNSQTETEEEDDLFQGARAEVLSCARGLRLLLLLFRDRDQDFCFSVCEKEFHLLFVSVFVLMLPLTQGAFGGNFCSMKANVNDQLRQSANVPLY